MTYRSPIEKKKEIGKLVNISCEICALKNKYKSINKTQIVFLEYLNPQKKFMIELISYEATKGHFFESIIWNILKRDYTNQI